ncbi:MAG: bacterial Ig-like domain-containing protein [Vagococcus sp.]|uniref:bacterial Ig-like domain-containing protein n=1 Tax=Vagococcus sp. TaxID=1933889 RepID=UPI002FCA9FF3
MKRTKNILAAVVLLAFLLPVSSFATSDPGEVNTDQRQEDTSPTVSVKSISVKDTNIPVGEKWQPSSSFNYVELSDGKKLEWNAVANEVNVNGNVDTAIPGIYKITYTYAGQQATANVTVKEMEVIKVQELSIKNTDHQLGNKWDASQNFNYVMLSNGVKLSWNEVAKDIKVSGNVDIEKPGVYKVIYDYQGVKKEANVTVKEMEVIKVQELSVKDTNHQLGIKWDASQNFNYVMLTNGIKLTWNEVAKDIKVTGNVDVEKPGVYKVTYDYQGVKKEANVTVKEMEVIKVQELSVKNITLAIGAKWDASQNFNYVMLTNGIKLSWNEVKDNMSVTTEDGKLKAEEFVDTNKAGEYKIKYTYEDQSVTAIVKVGEQAVKPNPNTNTTNKKILPQTGEGQNTMYLLVGITIVLIVLGTMIFKRRKRV